MITTYRVPVHVPRHELQVGESLPVAGEARSVARTLSHGEHSVPDAGVVGDGDRAGRELVRLKETTVGTINSHLENFEIAIASIVMTK